MNGSESTGAEEDLPSAESTPRWRPPVWLLAGLAVLVALMLAVDGWLIVRYQDEQRNSADLDRTLSEAPTVAEEAANAVLSYQWDDLEKNTAAAERFLSDEYRPGYTSSMEDLVADAAEDSRATVEAKVRSSGVVAADQDRCEVLLFVNQTTVSTTTDEDDPKTALNRVIFTMLREDERWVVDEIKAL